MVIDSMNLSFSIGLGLTKKKKKKKPTLNAHFGKQDVDSDVND